MLSEDVQNKILKFLYDKWIEDFVHHTNIEDAPLEGISEEAIIANAEYLASKGLIEKLRMHAKITVFGVDQVEDRRISPDIQKRIRILEIFKEHFEREPHGLLSREGLLKLTSFSKEEIERNVWYLGKKGLIKVHWALGGHFSARITDTGIDMLRRPTLLENEQKVMSYGYSIFYALENKLRIFIERRLTEKYGDELWDKIDENIKTYAESAKSKEKDSTLSLVNYMLFKHLRIIVGKNWDIFQGTFKSTTGIVSRLDELEPIRRKIAHCRLLSNDELEKLGLFFREINQMITQE